MFLTEMSWFISFNMRLNCQMEKPDFQTVISCCEHEDDTVALLRYIFLLQNDREQTKHLFSHSPQTINCVLSSQLLSIRGFSKFNYTVTNSKHIMHNGLLNM